MRCLFDQYVHPENRLTHALVASLAEDPSLLRSFLRWLDVAPPRGEPLHLVEQRLPGETDDRPETSESDTRRLPDAWIYAASGWALLIESKIASPIDAAQLRGHLAIAERRGFTDVRRSYSRRTRSPVPCRMAASTAAGEIFTHGRAPRRRAAPGQRT